MFDWININLSKFLPRGKLIALNYYYFGKENHQVNYLIIYFKKTDEKQNKSKPSSRKIKHKETKLIKFKTEKSVEKKKTQWNPMLVLWRKKKSSQKLIGF